MVEIVLESFEVLIFEKFYFEFKYEKEGAGFMSGIMVVY